MKRFLFGAALLFSASAFAAEVEIEGAFTTGNGYRGFSKNNQLSYVIGVIDGLKMAPTLGGQRKGMQWFTGCINGMEADQIKAIVDKFLADNPGRWHEPMHALVFSSLLATCPRK